VTGLIRVTTNSAKKKARISLDMLCDQMDWKKNDAGTRRWKEEKRMTKEKMDG